MLFLLLMLIYDGSRRDHDAAHCGTFTLKRSFFSIPASTVGIDQCCYHIETRPRPLLSFFLPLLLSRLSLSGSYSLVPSYVHRILLSPTSGPRLLARDSSSTSPESIPPKSHLREAQNLASLTSSLLSL